DKGGILAVDLGQFLDEIRRPRNAANRLRRYRDQGRLSADHAAPPTLLGRMPMAPSENGIIMHFPVNLRRISIAGRDRVLAGGAGCIDFSGRSHSVTGTGSLPLTTTRPLSTDADENGGCEFLRPRRRHRACGCGAGLRFE